VKLSDTMRLVQDTLPESRPACPADCMHYQPHSLKQSTQDKIFLVPLLPTNPPVGDVGCELDRGLPGLPPPPLWRMGGSRGGSGSCVSSLQPYMLAVAVSLDRISSSRSILD
jgi:hypothetical protein